MPKRKDNIGFVKDLMSYSQFGPLAQLFVMDALQKWSEIISETDPAKLDNPLISGEAWVAVAKEIKGKLEERMG